MNKNINKQTEDKNKLVEDIGIAFEKISHTPMTGRIFGLLLLAKPPYKSFESIVKEL